MELLKNDLNRAKEERARYQSLIKSILEMDGLTDILLKLLDEYRDAKWRLDKEIECLENKLKKEAA